MNDEDDPGPGTTFDLTEMLRPKLDESRAILAELNDDCKAHLIHISNLPLPQGICKIVHLHRPVTTFGRSSSVHVQLNSSLHQNVISRQHALIENFSNNFIVRDLNSLNGITVNGKRVMEATLNDGDVVGFGVAGIQPLGTSIRGTYDMIYQFKLNNPPANSSAPILAPATSGVSINAIAQSMAKKRAATEDEHQNISPKKRKLNPPEPVSKQNSTLSRDDSLSNMLSNDECLNWSECDEITKSKLEKIEERFIAQLQRKEEKFLAALRKKEEDLLKRMRVKEEEIELREKAVEERERALFDEEIGNIACSFHEMGEKLMSSADTKNLVKKIKDTSKQEETLLRSEIEEDFTCSICQDLLLNTHMLECSHSFCKDCLMMWLIKKKQCPVCRHHVVKAPVRALSIDSLVNKLISKLPQEEQEQWKDRISLTSEESQIAKLKELVNMAKEKKLRFLHITETWSLNERKVFQEGVCRYVGAARMLYCETTGLTKEFIDFAPYTVLSTAATNLEIPCLHMTLEQLKQKLLDFIAKEPAF
jgi:hypothetical protein